MRSLGFLSLFALAACAAPSSGSSADPPPAATVAGSTWFAEGSAGVEEAQRPRLEFQKDGRLAGYTGCNSVGGSWRESNGTIQVSALAVTKRFCMGPAGESEKRFLAAVNEKARITLAPGGGLVAEGANGARLAFTTQR